MLQDAYHLSCTANTKLRFNTTFLADCFDTSSALLEKSLRLSTSSSQEKSCLSLSCHTYYMGCLSSYFEAYHTLDQDRILALEYRYSLLMDRLSVLGFDIGEISGTEPSISPILYDAAWKDWCWSWSSNTLATWCKDLTHLKRAWCWERLKAGG